MNRGFTLIETVIYIGLLGLIMSGAVVAVYQLLSGASSVNDRNTAQAEGVFVIGKINWALSGAKTISTPTSWGETLSLTKYDGTTVDIRLKDGAIEMREDGGSNASTTTSNVDVTSLQFHKIPASGGSPVGVEASTTIGGENFYTKRYLRE